MTLNKIILKNFRTHRSASFDFSEGVTAIIGGNGSGKSSIVEAIVFLLTGEGYGKTKAEMLTVGQTSGYVIGHLEIDGKEAVLERHVDTAKVNFMYDGKTYKKSGEVNELWDSLFQIDKNIVQNVIVSNQGEIAMLFNGDNATKEKLFQKIFMVPNTSKIRDVAWSYIKEAPPEYPVKDSVELSSNLQCLEKTIELTEEELSKLELDNKQYEDLIARKAYLGKVEESFKLQEKIGPRMEEALEKSRQLTKSIDSLRDKLQLIKIQDYRDCLAEQKAQKSLFDSRASWLTKKASLTKPSEELDKSGIQLLQKKELELEADLKVKREKVAALNKQIEEYEKSGLASGVCPTCGTELQDIATLVTHTSSERATIISAGKIQKTVLTSTQNVLTEKTKHLQAWEAYEKELQTIESALETYKDVNFDQEAYDLCASVIDKYNNWENKLNSLNNELRDADNVVNRLNVETASLTAYDKDITGFNAEKIVIGQKILDFQNTQEAAKKLEIAIAADKREVKSIKQDLTDNASYIDKNNKRSEYTGILKSVYDLFHTGKFPRALIQTYSSTVSEYMNEVLESFDFPYSAKVNETFGIDVYNEEGLLLPSISGGQQVMVGFSLRLALHNMFVGAFPFMIVDEGSYGLNNDNAKKYFEIIKTLGKTSKFKQVIVIDHHTELSEYVDNTINL